MTAAASEGPRVVIATTAREYARALHPHLRHPGYRADAPRRRLLGKGCRACGVEVVIAIADFRATGDLAAFEEELKAATAAKESS